MEFEKKVLSREIQQYLYESGKKVGTAESCTGGRVAEAIIAVPGASAYFKGGVVSYTNDIKESILGAPFTNAKLFTLKFDCNAVFLNNTFNTI